MRSQVRALSSLPQAISVSGSTSDSKSESRGSIPLWSAKKSKKRLEINPYVKLIDDQAKLIKQRQENSEFTLNYMDLIKQKEIESFESEKFKKLNEFNNKLSFYPTITDSEKISNDSILIKKRERWEESLSKDIYLDEAINILNDLKKATVDFKKVAQATK